MSVSLVKAEDSSMNSDNISNSVNDWKVFKASSVEDKGGIVVSVVTGFNLYIKVPLAAFKLREGSTILSEQMYLSLFVL